MGARQRETGVSEDEKKGGLCGFARRLDLLRVLLTRLQMTDVVGL